MLANEKINSGSIKPIKMLRCMGFRAEESTARAKRQVFETRYKRESNSKRVVDVWLPIHSWTETQVWDSIKESGIEHHPAYDLGMPRLSCIFCIFAPKAALILAGQHNPELLEEYCQVEREIGHAFKQGLKIQEVQDAITQGATGGDMSGSWNM